MCLLQYSYAMESNFLSDLVSQATGGVIGGALGGSAVLLAQRFLGRFGKIDSAVREKKIIFHDTSGGTPEPVVDRSNANEVWYAFTVRFFNSKLLNTGLRDIRVEFERPRAGSFSHTPYDPERPVSVDGLSNPTPEYEEVDLLNLPSGEWVIQKLRGRIEGQAVEEVAGCEKVVLVGYLFNDKKLRVELSTF